MQRSTLFHIQIRDFNFRATNIKNFRSQEAFFRGPSVGIPSIENKRKYSDRPCGRIRNNTEFVHVQIVFQQPIENSVETECSMTRSQKIQKDDLPCMFECPPSRSLTSTNDEPIISRTTINPLHFGPRLRRVPPQFLLKLFNTPKLDWRERHKFARVPTRSEGVEISLSGYTEHLFVCH